MTDIAAAARISAYVAERKRHLDARADVIHGFGLGQDAKVLRASDIAAVLADLSGLTSPERCQDCATDPAGPCGICAIAIYGDVDGLAYLDARDALRAVTAQRDDAQRAGLKIADKRDQLKNRLDEIRAVLDADTGHAEWPDDAVTRLRAIVDLRRRAALRQMTRGDEADGLLDVGTGFVDTRGPEDVEPRFPYRQHPHNLCGSNSERQSVGDPGHCEDCCSVGHVVAHPDLGCGDVGCNSDHPEGVGRA